MSSRDDDRAALLPALRRRAAPARYLFALAAVLLGTTVADALLETQVSDQPIYAPLIGAVALTAWYGGIGPASVVVVAGWSAALWLFVQPRGELFGGDSEDLTRWWVNLAVAAIVVGASGLLRARGRRVEVEARTAIRDVESLQQLSFALSGASSAADVATVVTAHAAELLDTQGVALSLVAGDELEVVASSGIGRWVRPVGERLPLQRRTLLTEAARTGSSVRASDRPTIERSFSDSARVLPKEVEGAVAVPLRAGTKVIGSLAFYFGDGAMVDDEVVALAGMVADLAGQSLERAQLYDREREMRRALDRILRVAPRFLVENPDDVIAAICREARRTFGADHGILWRVRDDRLELLSIDPPRPDLDGSNVPLDDFPLLREAMERPSASFVTDARETTHGEGLAFVRELGIRSSLRAPVVIGGTRELVLAISWDSVVSEPDAATLVVVRRFADAAGLALVQLERRRAEADASARADATRRLQDVTAALSGATTVLDVSSTCLEHALAAVGADAGFVVLHDAQGTTVEIVTNTGYDDDELEAWGGYGLDDDVPFALAMASREPVWALTSEEMSLFTGARETRSAGWITIPFVTGSSARGALHVSLRSPKVLSQGERDWLVGMVSQCSLALERSRLYEDEQQSRRRAERQQEMNAALSNALTTSDVAEIVVEAVRAAVDADSVAVYGVTADGEVGAPLAVLGEQQAAAPRADAASGESMGRTPGDWAVRTRVSRLLDSIEAVETEFPAGAAQAVATGHETFLYVPLVAATRVNALLAASWERRHSVSPDSRSFVELLAAQAALVLDRASLFESQQTVAETLQRSVLPTSLPRVEGVHLAARYLPGSVQVDVGGDWFDALHLPGGKLALIVGDVVGKGVQAAASMAQLRNAIRAYSVEPLKPSTALSRLNRLAEEVLGTTFATVAYLVLDPKTGSCRIASAGHPPPLVAYPDGRVELLETVRGLPLGTGIVSKYRQETLELPHGTLLILYTDGLVERRGSSIDEGLAALRAAVAEAPGDPDRLLDHILERMVGSKTREDDIALLAARLLPVAPVDLDLRIPVALDSMDLVRDAMRAWLQGVPVERDEAEELVLATWEACANAIEHAVDPASDLVTIRAQHTDSVVRVVVKDTGTWRPATERVGRGLGLRLIEALVSSVDVSSDARGTTVTVEKSVGRG